MGGRRRAGAPRRALAAAGEALAGNDLPASCVQVGWGGVGHLAENLASLQAHCCRSSSQGPSPPLHPPPTPSLRPACRDALGAARMLGRTLALPSVLCYCDYDEHPGILKTCRIK